MSNHCKVCGQDEELRGIAGRGSAMEEALRVVEECAKELYVRRNDAADKFRNIADDLRGRLDKIRADHGRILKARGIK